MALREKLRQRAAETVEVLGEAVEVRALSARELVALEDAVEERPDGKNDGLDFWARLVVACTYDAAGARAFTEDDLGWLKDEADVAALKALFDAACRLNGINRGGAAKN